MKKKLLKSLIKKSIKVLVYNSETRPSSKNSDTRPSSENCSNTRVHSESRGLKKKIGSKAEAGR
jgi:hypothetical protein